MRVVVLSILTLSALLALAVGCAPATPKPTATPPPATSVPIQMENAGLWDVVLQKKVEQPLRVAAFLDESFGLTGGPSDAGKAHITTDGGQTWEEHTILADIGKPYSTHDGMLLTVASTLQSSEIAVLRYVVDGGD